MKISKKEFQQVVQNLVGFLERERIVSLDDLAKRVDRSYEVPEQKGAFVSVEEWPSSFGTTALTLSYVVPGTGVPVEIRINPQVKYTLIILKAETEILGYEPFMLDPFNNIIQLQNLNSIDFAVTKAELERLTKE